MAFQYTAWAWNTETGSSASKFLLMALADAANADGRSWIGQARLAAMTEMGERTVRRHLADLETAGLIRRRKRYRDDGTRTSDYADLPPASTTGQIGRWPESTTGHSDRDYRPERPRLPAAAAGYPSVEPSVEPPVLRTSSADADIPSTPSREDERNEAEAPRAQLAPRDPRVFRGDAQELLDAYNEHRGPLPAAMTLNSTRQRKLTTLIRDLGHDNARAAMIAGTIEVSTDPWWIDNRYNLDNLLHYQRIVQKAEVAADRARTTGTMDRTDSDTARMLAALDETPS